MNKRIKKLLVVGAATASLGVLSLGLSSCGRLFGRGDAPACEQHEWQVDHEKLTCTEGGWREYICLKCGHSRSDERVSPTGHNLVDGQCVNGYCEAGLQYELNGDGTAYTVVEFEDPLLWSGDSIEDVEEELRQYVITEIEIPAEYNGLPVTAIGEDAFNDCDGLKEVVLPQSLKTIEDSAFCGCDGFTKFVIPDSVTSLGERVFAYCNGFDSISDIKFSKNLTEIPAYTFMGCEKFTELVIPDGITVVGEGAFSGCVNIEKVTLSPQLKTFKGSFEEYLNLTDIHYNVTNGNIDLGFYMHAKIKPKFSVTIGANVERIPGALFEYCDVTSVTFEENSVCKTIGNYAFRECNLLTEFVIPDSVEEIGGWVFCRSLGLKYLTIGKGVTTLGTNAFFGLSALDALYYNAENLTTVSGDSTFWGYGWSNYGGSTWSEKDFALYIGDNIKALPEDLFHFSMDFTGVYVGSLQDWFSVNGDVRKEILTVSPSSDFYVDGKELTELIVPETITEIPDNAFYKVDTLTKIVLHDNVTSVGTNAFYECANVTSLTLGENLATVGDYAFRGLTALSKIEISSLESWLNCNIPLTAKLYMEGVTLTSVTIPNSVTEIREDAFNGCKSLTEVYFHSGVTSIGFQAFSGCTALKDIYNLPSNVQIGSYAFSSTAIETFTIPENSTLGSYVISSSNFKELVYCAENATLSDYTFGMSNYTLMCSAKNLKDLSYFKGLSILNIQSTLAEFCATDYETSPLTYAPTVTVNGAEIGRGAIEIPSGVTKIGKNAFNGAAITEVTIPSSVTSLGENAFANCASLTAINGGENVRECGDNAVDYELVKEYLYNGIYYKFNTITRLESTDIQSIAIREGTRSIPANFFEGCTSLMHVYVPYGCEIGDRAFINTNLTIRILLGDTDYASGDWRILLENDSGTFLVGGTAYVNGTKTALGAIVNGVAYDEQSGFAYRYESDLPGVALHGYFGAATALTLPSTLGGNTVVKVGDSAFMTLPIKQVIAPATITEIDEYAFALCDQLTSASIESVEEVGSFAFQSCTALTDVTMEAAIYIRVGAFYECTALQTIVLPSTIKYINNYAFYNAGLTSATFADATHKWYMEGSNGTTLATTNAATNAKNLSTTYAQYGWIIDTEVSE